MSTDSLPGTMDSGFDLSLPQLAATPRKSFLRAIHQTLRRDGVGVAFCELAYRLARRFVDLQIAQALRLDLAAMRPLQQPAIDLAYRFLNAAEVRAAASDPALELDAAMAERLHLGRNYCFGAFHGDRLANYSWYALEFIEPKHGSISGFTFPADTVFLYKAYTLPGYRGQRIHGAAIRHAVRFFRQRGITQLIAIVEFGNRASLRSHQGLGCRPAGRLLRIGRRSLGWGCGSLRRS